MKIFICACEPSGDLYSAHYLRRYYGSGTEIVGVGGEELKRVGARLFLTTEQLSIFGFASGLTALRKNLRLYRMILRKIREEKPDIFIAVAYPGLNILLCRVCKKMKIKVFYLLPPQIWAWGNFRKYLIKRYTDLVISFFKFEVDYYRKKGIKIEYIKNPLIDYLSKIKGQPSTPITIGLMPGSRRSQIDLHLDLMVEIADRLRDSIKDLKFKVILHNKYLLNQKLPNWIEVVYNNRYVEMSKCSLILLSSGTASLEAGLLKIPHLHIYNPHFSDLIFSRLFVRIKEFNIVNIILGSKAVPVFFNPRPDVIKDEVLRYLNEPGLIEEAKRNFQKLIETF